MSQEDQYNALSQEMVKGGAEAEDEAVVISYNRAAAAYRTAARFEKIARRKEQSATTLRQLSIVHFRRGNHIVAARLSTDAMTHEAAIPHLTGQAENQAYLASAARGSIAKTLSRGDEESAEEIVEEKSKRDAKSNSGVKEK